MKLADSIIIPALCWTARLAAAAATVAAAAPAHVYIHDPQSQHTPATLSRSLEPVPARLVLAQRAGVEDYHTSDLSRQESIDAINDYGLRTLLFAAAERNPKKAFILLQGVEVADASLESYTSFNIAPAPPARDLFIDLAKQSHPTAWIDLSYDLVAELLRDIKKTSGTENMFYIASDWTDMKTTLTRLQKTEQWSITVLVAPSNDAPSKEDRFQWGAYEMPGVQAPLRKRQQKDQGFSIYEQGKEEPLTDTRPAKSARPLTSPVVAFANNTEPFRGIKPACYTSKAAAESSTRNCTGHGIVKQKYHDPTASSSGIDCWHCKCITTTKNGRGTKWGGPACQKKDVSIEFWLITLFTVGMIFLVGFAIGSVWEMGSQELPSVIGAGVSGPTARK